MYFIINYIQPKRGLGNVNDVINKTNLLHNAPNSWNILFFQKSQFLKNLFILFIYFWLGQVFVAACRLSLVAAAPEATLRCSCTGLSLRWLLPLQSTGSRHTGFSSCGAQTQQFWLAGSRAQAQQLWHTGPAAPRHVGSSRTRA